MPSCSSQLALCAGTDSAVVPRFLCAGYGDFDPRLYPFYHVVGLHKSNPLVAGRPMAACGSCLEVQRRGTNVSS